MNAFSRLTPSAENSFSSTGPASSTRFAATRRRGEHLQRMPRGGLDVVPQARGLERELGQARLARDLDCAARDAGIARAACARSR